MRRNEAAWGLAKHKVQASTHLVWYDEARSMEELKRRKLLG